jgi:two-component system response regulator PilR (NtrC family)
MSASTPISAERTSARTTRAPRVLVVDDEADLRELLQLTLVRMGLDVDCASDLSEARRFIGDNRYDLCLTDMRLPDGDGLSLVAEIARSQPNTPVAVITAYGSAESAVAALKAGAFDYVAKPVGLDALRALVRSALRLPAQSAAPSRVPGSAQTERASALDDAAPARPPEPSTPAYLPAAASDGGLIGVSETLEQVRVTIARLGRSMAPVAITGESGSGKEPDPSQQSARRSPVHRGELRGDPRSADGVGVLRSSPWRVYRRRPGSNGPLSGRLGRHLVSR